MRSPHPSPRKASTGLLVGLVVVLAGALWFWQQRSPTQLDMSEPIITRLVGEYEVAVLGRKSDLITGTNPIRIEVTDPKTGEKMAVDAVSLQLDMDMPGMQMRAQGRFEEAADVGALYRCDQD